MRLACVASLLCLVSMPLAAEEVRTSREPETTGSISETAARPADAAAVEPTERNDCLDVFFDPRSVRELKVCGIGDE